jgi:hypothetical protein
MNAALQQQLVRDRGELPSRRDISLGRHFDPRSATAEGDDEPSAVNTGREWSHAELNELGDMLVRGQCECCG